MILDDKCMLVFICIVGFASMLYIIKYRPRFIYESQYAIGFIRTTINYIDTVRAEAL